MPEAASSTVVILLSSILGALVLLLAAGYGILRSLGRIERRLAERDASRESAELTPTSAEVSSGGAFEAFLNEEPARRNLPKSEQFTAYRRWRQEKGLNWSNS